MVKPRMSLCSYSGNLSSFPTKLPIQQKICYWADLQIYLRSNQLSQEFFFKKKQIHVAEHTANLQSHPMIVKINRRAQTVNPRNLPPTRMEQSDRSTKPYAESEATGRVCWYFPSLSQKHGRKVRGGTK